MTALVTIRSYPQGPRLWVAGQRIHHGATGAVLAAWAASQGRRRRKLLTTAAVLLCLHDRRDARVWFARETLPASTLDNAGSIN